MNATKMPDGTWAVESMSGAERAYRVDPVAGHCSCPHYQTRLVGTDKLCKHITSLRAHLAALAAPKSEYERAAERAQGLSDEQLLFWAAKHSEGPVACACRLELAARKLRAVPAEPKPIPAAVEAFLVGATEAERERALAIYK